MKKSLLISSVYMLIALAVAAQNTSTVFTNPLLSKGPDPWVIYRNGFYYYTNTTGNRVDLWKTETMQALPNAVPKTIWKPTAGNGFSRIWAPELHFLQGKWYMYFCAIAEGKKDHRLYVLENSSADPMEGEWVLKGKVGDPSDKWAIDASVFEHKNQMYLLWSGWPGETNGAQNIYIAKMKNPYTVESERVLISQSDYDWEKIGDVKEADKMLHVNVNEGPEVIKHGKKLFLVYSASGCWTDHYALGMLTASASSDLMDPKSWKKSPKPVFETNAENSVYAPGHNGFFKSPNGKEDWIIYHANPTPGCGCGDKRSPRMQKITWKKDGTPDFGIPVKPGVELPVPAK